MARLVAITSLSWGAVLEWTSGSCEGKGSGETTMSHGLVTRLSGGDVLLVERYCAGYFMLALLQQGVDVVVRQHQLRHTDFRRDKPLGKCDHIALWQRPERPPWMDPATYVAIQKHLTLREVRVGY